MAFFFSKVPGSSLRDLDKTTFSEVVSQIDICTTDALEAPDLAANAYCAELLMTVSREVLTELIFYLRRRIDLQGQPRVVLFTLQLIDYFSKTIGTAFLSAINEERFCKKLSKITVNYAKISSSGLEYQQIASQACDMIQYWGLSLSQQSHTYPLLIKMYRTLQQNNLGLPFKRPIVVSPDGQQYSQTGRGYQQQQQIDQQQQLQQMERERQLRARSAENDDVPRRVKVDILDSLTAAATMLYEVLFASENADELRENESAAAIAEQIAALLPLTLLKLDSEAEKNPEKIESIFEVTDKAKKLLDGYNKICLGELDLFQFRYSLAESSPELASGEDGRQMAVVGTMQVLAAEPSFILQTNDGNEPAHFEDSSSSYGNSNSNNLNYANYGRSSSSPNADNDGAFGYHDSGYENSGYANEFGSNSGYSSQPSPFIQQPDPFSPQPNPYVLQSNPYNTQINPYGRS